MLKSIRDELFLYVLVSFGEMFINALKFSQIDTLNLAMCSAMPDSSATR